MEIPRTRPPRRPPFAPALALALLAAACPAAARAQDDARPLAAGSTVSGELKPGEERGHRLDLAAGWFVRLAVNLLEGEVTATLLDPGGRSLVEIGGEGVASFGPRAFLTEAAGVYRLVVRAGGRAGGRYELRIEEARAASAEDRSRVAAERAYARAVQLQFGRGGREELRAAVASYEEARAGWRAAGDRSGEARALGGLGAAHSSLGDSRRAAAAYEEELQIFRAAGDRRREASLREDLGWLYLNAPGLRGQSFAHLEEARRLYRELSDREGEARALMLLGHLHGEPGAAAGDAARKALDYYTQALAAYAALGDLYGEADALGRLMLAWRSLRRPPAAIFFGKKSVNLYQQLRAGMGDLEEDTRRTFLRSKEETYRSLADLLIAEGRLPEAEEVLGLLKEEEFSDFIRREGGGASGPAARGELSADEAELDKKYREIEATLTTRGRMIGDLLGKESRTAEEEQSLARWRAEIGVANRAFERLLNRIDGELRGTDDAGKGSELRQARGLMSDLADLGEGSVALYTLVTKDKYRLILITPHVRKAYERAITREELGQKVLAFRRALQDPKSDPRAAAKELYDIVLGPAAKDLVGAGAETLMWSLDGVLRYAPVAALHDGERYLVERYRNSAFTSASKTRLKERPSAAWRGVGFGVSKAHEGFTALPSVPAELRGIFGEDAAAAAAGLLPGRVLLDELFTAESFGSELERRTAPVVHIASHFQLRRGDETNSFLLLGDGTHLSLGELSDSYSFGGVELLTLSACSTAVGGAGQNGKEVDGLAMLSELLGAKAVVATLWPVADKSTKALMHQFYRARAARAGTSKTEAMRQAQLALLRGEVEAQGAGTAAAARASIGEAGGPAGLKDFSHPYFWAPFIIIGNWR